MSIRWRRDDLAEDLLNRLGLIWEEKAIRLDSIDWGESLNNGARLDQPIIEELVEDYAMAMLDGSAFPKPVVHSYRGKSPVILSGNQRLESAKRVAKDDAVPVYFLTTEDKLKADLFLRMANVALGERSSRENRFQQAIYAVRVLGISMTDASKMFLVSDSAISLRIRSQDIRRELDKANVPNAEMLTMSHCHELGKLNPEFIPKVATVCSIALPSAERLNQAVASINAQKTQAGKIKKLREFESELKESAKQRPVTGTNAIRIRKARRDKIISSLTTLVNFLETGNDGEGFTDFEQMQCHSEKDRTTVSQLWRRIKVRLSVVCGE